MINNRLFPVGEDYGFMNSIVYCVSGHINVMPILCEFNANLQIANIRIISNLLIGIRFVDWHHTCARRAIASSAILIHFSVLSLAKLASMNSSDERLSTTTQIAPARYPKISLARRKRMLVSIS